MPAIERDIFRVIEKVVTTEKMDKTGETWENASLASTMTDIEQVTKLATQLGRTERENEDLKKSLEVRKALESFLKNQLSKCTKTIKI